MRLAEEIGDKVDFPENLARALIADGSRRCVAEVLRRAAQRAEGSKWLVACTRHAFMHRGHIVGEYYTHIDDAELVKFIMAGESGFQPKEKWDVVWAFGQIDSEHVREALREIASRAETEQDAIVRDDGLKLSFLAHEELMRRGDPLSVPYFVSDTLKRERVWFSISLEHMDQFPSKAIASEVKQRLAASPTSPDDIARLLSLLGKFGSFKDAQSVEAFLSYTDELVRNVAYETKCRLTDPLRLATDWQELLIQ